MENKEMALKKAKKCATVEELIALAKENDVEMTDEQAEDLFARLNKAGEIGDEELENVAGSGCESLKHKCPKCKSTKLTRKSAGYYFKYHCEDCGYEWEEAKPIY